MPTPPCRPHARPLCVPNHKHPHSPWHPKWCLLDAQLCYKLGIRQEGTGTRLGVRQAGNGLVQAGARVAAQEGLQRAQHLRSSRKYELIYPSMIIYISICLAVHFSERGPGHCRAPVDIRDDLVDCELSLFWDPIPGSCQGVGTEWRAMCSQMHAAAACMSTDALRRHAA